MRWIARSAKTRARGERGAVAVVVAAVVSCMALALLALSVDAANGWYERRQLQNGADAAAFALAQACAQNLPDCASQGAALGAGKPLAGANDNYANDGLQKLRLCGSGDGTGALDQCPPASTDTSLSNCIWRANLTAHPYVEARTGTETKQADPALLPRFFSNEALASQACARATWGPAKPPSATVLGITISECDWKKQTGSGVSYPAGPSGAWPGYSDSDPNRPWPTVENGVWTKGNPVAGCDTSSPGGTAPGGFAWLTTGVTSCKAVVENGWVTGEGGAAGSCTAADLQSQLGKVVFLPVFDCMAKIIKDPIPTAAEDPGYCSSGVGGGGGTNYHVSGYAAFYLSGWNLVNGQQGHQDNINPKTRSCELISGHSNDLCLTGFFLKGLLSDAEMDDGSSGTPNYGVMTVQAAG